MTDKDEKSALTERKIEETEHALPDPQKAGTQAEKAQGPAPSGVRQANCATKSGRPRGRLYDLLNNSDRF